MRSKIALSSLVSLALLALPAGAAPPGKPSAKAPAKVAPAKPPAVKVDIAGATQKLKSGDEGQIRAALDDLRIGAPGAGPAAPAIAEILGQGLNEPLTIAAIETLGEIEAPEGSSVLGLYATHRVVAIRRAAVKALVRTKGPVAVTALRRALGDGDMAVRGNAAGGLGNLKAKEAVGDLFLALDHKVVEAAAAIGQLCNAEQCEQLVGKLGSVPFDVVQTGLDQALSRSSAEVSDDTKIKIIGRVRELGTAEANKFLKEVEAHLPKDTSPRVKQSLEQALRATAGGAQ